MKRQKNGGFLLSLGEQRIKMNGPLLPTLSPTRRGDVASTRERGSDRFKELEAAAWCKGGCKREEEAVGLCPPLAERSGGSADGGLEAEDRWSRTPCVW